MHADYASIENSNKLKWGARTVMRYINFLLAIMMLLFVAVQYNDPDGPLWMTIYMVPVVWALFAALRPYTLRQTVPAILLALSIVLSVGLVWYYWPKSPGWWRQDVWWEVEAVREGLGMMIMTIVLLIAWLSGRLAQRPDQARVD